MTLKIFKYSMDLMGTGQAEYEFNIPESSRLLDVQSQNGCAVMWFLVDTTREEKKREFSVYGTGHEVPTKKSRLDPSRNTLKDSYLGTFQLGGFVGHVFEVLEDRNDD